MREYSSFSLQISPSWSAISQIRKQIRLSLRTFEKESADKAEIIASELLENAIKYGNSDVCRTGVLFRFEVDLDSIFLSVSNSIFDEYNKLNFLRIMDEIKNSKDLHKLYIDRLKSIMVKADIKESELGLYRIFYNNNISESSYKIENNILDINIKINLSSAITNF